MSMLQEALGLRAEGFSFIPLKSHSKDPDIETWERFQNELPSEAAAVGWFASGDRNYGIVCGKVSGNLVVIDFDEPEMYTAWMKKYAAVVGECPVVKTSRGYHVYVRTSSPAKSKRLPHIDVQGDGHYVVGPGSIHPSGTIYSVVQGELAKIPVVDPELLALEVAEEEPRLGGNGKSKVELIAVYREGERNSGLYRDACAMRNRGLSREALRVALLEENRQQCEPPLPDWEVEGIVESSMKRSPHPREWPPLQVIGVAEILKAPPVSWLIEDLFFDRTLSLLGAYAGRGKSLIALSLAKSIATGEPLFGRYAVKRTGKVLFVDEENSHSDLRDRMIAMRITEDMPIRFVSFQGVLVDEEPCFQRLMELIKAEDPVLVVLDSLVRLHKAKENDASEMSRVMRQLRLIVNEGYGLQTLHHHTKGTGDLEARARGSSDIVGAVDVEYALDLRGDDLVLCSVKSRRAPIEPVRLRIETVDEALAVKYVGPGTYKRDEVRSAVVEVLSVEGEATFNTIFERIRNQGINVSERTMRDYLREMVGHGIRERHGSHNRKLYEVETNEI